MVVRSDSEIGALLTLLVLFLGFLGLLTSVGLLVFRKFHAARKTFLISAGGVGVYVAIVSIFAFVSPQTIVNIGDSYCMDIWCISVRGVNKTVREQDVLYKIDVRIFSDANTVKTSAKGASVYLVDERGRRFQLIDDPSAIPFDTPLNPRESIDTKLTFAVAADAQHLFLPTSYHHIGDEGSVPFFVKLYFGGEANYLHKRTLLRVS